MNLVEFYDQLAGNYEDVKARLLKDERILRFLRKFPAAKELEELKAALAAGDWATAFRASHTLKGNCLNLGLDGLFAPSSELCENLRGGSPEKDWQPLLAAVEAEYQKTIEAIGQLTAC